MLDSKALASIPLVPSNTAPPAPDYPWPTPYTSAMFLWFDVDAESAWTSKDALHAQRLITMSYGGYEARVGTPKLLQLLDNSISRRHSSSPAGRSTRIRRWPRPFSRPAMRSAITAITTCCRTRAIPGSRRSWNGVLRR